MIQPKNAYVGHSMMFVLAVAVSLHAIPAVAETWERTFGRGRTDCGYSVQQTPDGGFMIVGNTESYVGFWYDDTSDVCLVKTDANGRMQWAETFGGSGYDTGVSLQPTADGGFIIAGYTAPYFRGEYDVCLIKTNSLGLKEWSRTYGGSLDDRGRSVQQTDDGGYIVVGETESFGAGLYLIKTNSLGDEQWSKTFPGATGWSVQQTTDGGFIVTGSVGGVEQNTDLYLLKTDANGNEQWSKTFGYDSFGLMDQGRSVQQTTDGGFIVAGSTRSYGPDWDNVYLIKTDPNGNEQWYKVFGGDSFDYGYSVQQTIDGGFIVAGETRSFGAGENDAYLIKTDANGNEQWSKTFGGSGWDAAHSVQQTADRGFVLCGIIDGENDWEGEGDIFLLYYNPDVDINPFVRANGHVGASTVATSDPLEITITLDVGPAWSGLDADWWVMADTPFGFYYCDNPVSGSWRPGVGPTHQGPMFPLFNFPVFNSSGLPPGSYTFYFGVDMVMNGVLDFDQLYLDKVEVEVEVEVVP